MPKESQQSMFNMKLLEMAVPVQLKAIDKKVKIKFTCPEVKKSN